MTGTADTAVDFRALNATLYRADLRDKVARGADREALRAYLSQHVEPRMRTFPTPEGRIEFLLEEGYYDPSVLARYPKEFVYEVLAYAGARGHRFQSYVGALKFYTSYAMTTYDGSHFLERYEDRAVMVALTLGAGDQLLVRRLLDELLSGRFQVTTPTLVNAGRARRGEMISCYLLRIEDNMESVSRAVNSAMQLSKRGGGISFLLTNVRAAGAPIRRVPGQAPGIVPVMKLLEDAFAYSHQLGMRQGAGAVYLHAHHPEILRFLDCKRENADEKVRIQSLSLGVVIPDVTFELARENKRMCLFAPDDIERHYGVPLSDIGVTARYEELVADERVGRTWIDARTFFRVLAELQFESGYPYVMFEDTVNRTNAVAGRVTHSNLCSEVLQISTPSALADDLSYSAVGRDISCNLGSINIVEVMSGPHLEETVDVAVRALSSASEHADLSCVPTVRRGNDAAHAIGIGQMNLHGFLARERIVYGSPEALEFTDLYFMTVAYYAISASNRLAVERRTSFEGFDESDYASGRYFDRYVAATREPRFERVRRIFDVAGLRLPTKDDWAALRDSVRTGGMFNQNLQAVAPNGSIAYLGNATASLHPVPARVEVRKEGRLGRVYVPAPHLNADNVEYFEDAYEVGYERLIDTYAAATPHVDQGLSLTLFFEDTATTRDINRAQIYAWRKGIKTLYYVRIRQKALDGTSELLDEESATPPPTPPQPRSGPVGVPAAHTEESP